MSSEQKPQSDNQPSGVASNALLGGWIPVADSMPEKNVWVQVYEDDTIDEQDAFINKLRERPLQRVTPAMLYFTDEENQAHWYLCYIGGPYEHVRNVTHWKPLSDPPNPQLRGAAKPRTSRTGCSVSDF